MKIIIAALGITSALVGTGCPPRAGQTEAPRYTLPEQPATLYVLEVPGARLITGGKFALFIVTDPGADTDALAAKVKACQQGQGCGSAMSSGETKQVYKMLQYEGEWENAVKAGHLVAVATVGSQRWSYARVADAGDVAAELLQLEARCSQPGAQPQCPSQPPIPKDVFRNVFTELPF